MKHILIVAAIALAACSKPKDEDCRKCFLIGEKFTIDSVYVRIDTLWQDVVCGAELRKVEAVRQDWWFLNCGIEPNQIEHWKYKYE